MEFEFDDDDKATTLAALLKQTIAADPFPMSPRVRQLRAILEKVKPSKSGPQPFPTTKAH